MRVAIEDRNGKGSERSGGAMRWKGSERSGGKIEMEKVVREAVER